MHRSADGAEPEEFTEAGSGVGAVGCLALFLGGPIAAGVYQLYERSGAVPAVALAAALVGALVGVYAFFNTETTVTLDDRGLRRSHRRVVFGLRGPGRVEWEIPAAALTRAREVKRHRPSKHGGWQIDVILQLPKGRTLSALSLGGDQDDRTAYARLTASLRRRLRSAFETEDDFGPIAAMKKTAAARPSADD